MSSVVRQLLGPVCAGMVAPARARVATVIGGESSLALRLAGGRAYHSVGMQLPRIEKYRKENEEFLREKLAAGPYVAPAVHAWVTSLSGERLNMIELDASVFAAAPRIDIMHKVVVWQRAKRRAGTASTKTKGEVRGGGRKPTPQKGSGRARQGSIRNPHMYKGGVALGPKPRDWSHGLPSQVRKMGLRSALSIKYAQGDLHIVDTVDLESPRTNPLARDLMERGWESVVLVSGDPLPNNLRLASGNIPACLAMSVRGLNVYDVLNFRKLVLSVDALNYITDLLKDTRRQTPSSESSPSA